MNAAASPVLSPRPARVVSIDIFRGLTMCVMIFVNELSGVKGLPWWTYHARAEQDLMTYVDMVFPFFLFIVGMSMPPAVEHRLRRNPSHEALWGHVLKRTLGLLTLGLILANAEFCSEELMGLDGGVWAIMGIVAAGLYLNAYPPEWRFKRLTPVLRGLGLAGVVVLLAIFRRQTRGGQVAWINFDYPEILGLIGLTYLAASALYIPTRRWRWAPAAWCVVLAAFNALCSGHVLKPPDWDYLWPFANGSRACVMMAGVATSQLFLRPGENGSPRRSMLAACGLAAVAIAAGVALMPLGISKDRETPAWALWNVGAAILAFTLLYWICDVKGRTRWACFARTAGENTLTTYLLPDLWDAALGALGVTYLATHWAAGWPGVARTVAFTALTLALSRLVTRCGVRLRF